MLDRFKHYASEQHLFPEGGEVLLAVSGGRDSVVMTDMMHRCGVRFAIAHCNFHLRPGECDRDERFVRELASRMGVRCHVADFDTVAYAAAHGLSIEEAARALRYSWFASLVAADGYACLATAHHRDDSVETFFLNLCRGTGIAGLHGILPLTVSTEWDIPLTVIRPMLCFSRSEIDAYAEAHGLSFVDDSTNAHVDLRRNAVRLRLMPMFREIYQPIDGAVEATMAHLHDAEVLLASFVGTIRTSLVKPYASRLPWGAPYIEAVDVAALQGHLSPFVQQPSTQRTLLFELLRPWGFNAAVVGDILRAIVDGGGGRLFLSPTHVAELHRGHLLLAERSEATPPTLTLTTFAVDEGSAVSLAMAEHDAIVEHFDADKLRQPLSLRLWQEGDRFRPLGMHGTRLVSDFLKDSRLSIIERRCVYMLVDADGIPVWIVGLRIDDRVKVTPSTIRMLRVAVR